MKKKYFLVQLTQLSKFENSLQAVELLLLSLREGCNVIQGSLVTSSFPLASANFSSAHHATIKMCTDSIRRTDSSTQMSHKNGSDETHPLMDVCFVTSVFLLLSHGASAVYM